MPAKITASIAGRPSGVPGILMKRLGLPPRRCRSVAAATVLSVSWARSGDTSSDTHPSTPSVLAKVGRNSSAARGTAAKAQSKNRSSSDFAEAAFSRNVLVIACAVLDRVIEDGGIRGEPCHRELIDIALERTGIQQLAGDVVEPEVLAHVVELSGRFHLRHLQAG